jgi:hypothetical protein
MQSTRGIAQPGAFAAFHQCVDRIPERVLRLIKAEAQRLALAYANKLAVVDILERIDARQYSLQDRGLIVAARSALQLFPFPKKAQANFVAGVNAIVYSAMLELEQLGYSPTRSTDRTELLRLQHHATAILADANRSLVAKLDTAEAILVQHLNNIMNGRYKSELAAWWLRLVSNAVSSFVSGMGYVQDAIPENYLDQPPQSLYQVRRNLGIIQVLQRSLREPLDLFHVWRVQLSIDSCIYSIDQPMRFA